MDLQEPGQRTLPTLKMVTSELVPGRILIDPAARHATRDTRRWRLLFRDQSPCRAVETRPARCESAPREKRQRSAAVLSFSVGRSPLPAGPSGGLAAPCSGSARVRAPDQPCAPAVHSIGAGCRFQNDAVPRPGLRELQQPVVPPHRDALGMTIQVMSGWRHALVLAFHRNSKLKPVRAAPVLPHFHTGDITMAGT